MRIEKVAILNEVTARVKDSDYCFILNYGGVDVVKIGAFRAALKGHDSRLLIVKNTFLAKAAKEKGWSDEVQAMLTGPTAIVTGKGEVTAVAKDVMDFVNGSDGRASVKGADYDGKIVDAAMVEALSKVPGKDQLRATLLMLLKEPATRLARVLSEKAKKEGGEAPAA
jgi:large subunit ribosomal protein L10